MTDKDVELAISQARQSILNLLEENKSYRIVRDEIVSLPLQSAAWEEMNQKQRAMVQDFIDEIVEVCTPHV